MELKYIVTTIIKIVISVPTISVIYCPSVDAAALMGGHLNNSEVIGNITVSNDNYSNDYNYDYNEDTIKEWGTTSTTEATHTQKHIESEELVKIPNSSPLVSSGYNLPENIFHNGKPYYIDIEPTTGHTRSRHKSSTVQVDNLHDQDEVSSDMYNKANINRKDGSLINHKLSDLNQLSPTFHDFLNLPMKYSNDKYVYPLISNSYANTKVQGNINKYYNHKLYENNIPAMILTSSPTYNFTLQNHVKENDTLSDRLKMAHTQPVTTRTTFKTEMTTVTATTTIKPPSLINSPINHPSFNEEYDYDFFDSVSNTDPHKTHKNINNIHKSTENAQSINTERPSTSTKRVLSLYQQLFGDYDEETTTKMTFSISSTTYFPNNIKFGETIEINKEYDINNNDSQPLQYSHINDEFTPTETEINMEIDGNYEYEDDYDVPSNKTFENGTQITELNTMPTPTRRLTTEQLITSIRPNLINKIITSTNKNDQATTTNISKPQSHITQNTTVPVVTTAHPFRLKNISSVVSKIPKMPVLNVTSLPYGENHIVGLNNQQSLILTTQDLTETLNKEMIKTNAYKYNRPVVPAAYNTNNIHIPPYQDTVSFVVGNYQNSGKVDYGTSFNANPYSNNAFKPFYKQTGELQVNKNTYMAQNYPEVHIFPGILENSPTIVPSINLETALLRNNSIKLKAENAIDDKLEVNSNHNELTKSNSSRISFPDEKEQATNYTPSFYNSHYGYSTHQTSVSSKIDDLNIHSNQMYQLPGDLTPPKKPILIPPTRIDRPRPPWDPRPGHFYAGKPEYTRPPRPPLDIAHRRVDNLPNILPQFRPNMNIPQVPPLHSHFDRFNRQPLLDRPSNRPLAFFERLHPPPPLKTLHTHRPAASQLHNKRPGQLEYNVVNKTMHKTITEQYPSYETPPKFSIAKRRNSENEEIETLQMINVKKAEKKITAEESDILETSTKTSVNNDNSLYVVYPVNSTPLKLDVINNHKKESVVVGTRAEIPLPPSKIIQQNDKNKLLNLSKDRTDSPVLKPHSKHPMLPIKSDFPYPLEIPNPPMQIFPMALSSEDENKLDDQTIKYQMESNHMTGIDWKAPERIMESQKVNKLSNQISATLKTYTETPIAVAYRPTQPQKNYFHDYIHSMPNYSTSTISKITSDGIENEKHDINNEMLLKKTIHVQPHIDMLHGGDVTPKPFAYKNHKTEVDVTNVPVQQEFQVPFQASVNIDSSNSQGWFVIRDKKLSTSQRPEVTTVPIATTSEFNIENFKPQLEGGFKPIYTPSNDQDNSKILTANGNDD